MKKNFYWILGVVCSLAVFTGCSDDDDDDVLVSDVPQAVMDGLQSKFPNVTYAEWENKLGYYVAEFWQEGIQTDVWISEQGEWCMTELDLGTNLSLLPEAVQAAFKSGSYATWRVDDLDKYERPDRTFFLIEVETQGEADRDLFYAPDGTLIKDEVDRENNDVTPTTKI